MGAEYPRCKYFEECLKAGTGQDEGAPGMGMCKILAAYTVLAIARKMGTDKDYKVSGKAFVCVDGQVYAVPN